MGSAKVARRRKVPLDKDINIKNKNYIENDKTDSDRFC